MLVRVGCVCVMWMVALLGLARPAQAQAQEVVEDTLDWRGYYPLQVGNHWEYEIKHGPLNQFSDFERRVITGDTLLDGTRYVIHEVQRYELLDQPDSTLELQFAATDYVRYDTVRAVLYAIPADSARRADRTDQRWPGSPFIYDYVDQPLTCKLNADFEERFTCESSVVDSIEVVADGGYLSRTYGGIHVRARKEFSESTIEITFEHGLGQRFGQVVYARVAGQEFGDSTVTRLDARRPPERVPDLGLSAYPNPAHAAAHFAFMLPRPGRVTLQVYDVLGRRIANPVQDAHLSAGEHRVDWNTHSVAPGVYVARMRLDGHAAAQARLVVVR